MTKHFTPQSATEHFRLVANYGDQFERDNREVTERARTCLLKNGLDPEKILEDERRVIAERKALKTDLLGGIIGLLLAWVFLTGWNCL